MTDDGSSALLNQLLPLPRRVVYSGCCRRISRPLQRCVRSVLGTHSVVAGTGDHAAAFPSEGSFHFDCDELDVQLARESSRIARGRLYSCVDGQVGESTPILQNAIRWRLYLIHAGFCICSFFLGQFSPLSIYISLTHYAPQSTLRTPKQWE